MRFHIKTQEETLKTLQNFPKKPTTSIITDIAAYVSNEPFLDWTTSHFVSLRFHSAKEEKCWQTADRAIGVLFGCHAQNIHHTSYSITLLRGCEAKIGSENETKRELFQESDDKITRSDCDCFEILWSFHEYSMNETIKTSKKWIEMQPRETVSPLQVTIYAQIKMFNAVQSFDIVNYARKTKTRVKKFIIGAI